MKFESNYLNKKLETKEKASERTISKEELLAMISEIDNGIDKQLENYHYKKEDNVNIEKGDTSISFSYRLADIEEKLDLLIPSMHLSKGVIRGIINVINNIRIIENFKIENKNGDKFNVYDVVGNDYKIITFANKKTGTSFIDDEGRIIALGEDLTTTKGILNFLHEVGHYQDFKELSVEEMAKIHDSRKRVRFRKKTKKVIEGDLEIMLRTERNAWAHALKNIKPFVNDLNIDIDDINKYSHGYCLQSYSDLIRRSFNK